MKCRKARSLIFDLITETIREGERRDLDLHLKDCPRCEKELTSLRNLISSLRSLPIPDPGEEFWRALPLRVEREIACEYQGRGFLSWIKGKLKGGWVVQPGRAAYAFVSMVIITIVTLLLFYPHYAYREGQVSRGEKGITVSVSPPGEEPVLEEGDVSPSRIEDLTDDQLKLLYSSLISSALQKREGQELFDERMGEIVLLDIGSELNDLDSDELGLLSRKLYLMYPKIQEKGAL